MTDQPAPSATRTATLSTWDTVSVIVGIVIGAGIYETPPLVFSNVPGPGMAIVAWIIGGLLCLNGAFTYAELASAYPRSGGDYVYLTRAYGSWLGFLFGWAQISVILTGSVGMMAYVFADYAATLWNFGPATTLVYALASVVVLTLGHVRGLALGKRVQNVLSSAKLIGLAVVVLAAFLFAAPPAAEPLEKLSTADALTTLVGAAFAFALVQILVTYGGWNDAAFFVAEMADRRKIVRALSLGIVVITVTYLLVNLAYLRVLGFQGSRDAQAIAAETMDRAVGPIGARGVALLVAVSALGAVNGLVFAGSRVYAAVGEDHAPFALLARKDPRFGTPLWSLLVQAAVTLAMIVVVGTETGQNLLNAAFGRLGFDEVRWAGQGGFETLLRCTAPVFWLFFLLTSVALFVLRYRDPEVPRPFTTPLYPLCPLFFSATCGYMFYGSIGYAGSLGLVGGTLLLAGLPVYGLSWWMNNTRTQSTAKDA